VGDGGADGGEKGKARFADLVALPDDEIPLDEAALLIAAQARPELDVGAELGRLDELAGGCGEATLDGLTHHLFTELGFTGIGVITAGNGSTLTTDASNTTVTLSSSSANGFDGSLNDGTATLQFNNVSTLHGGAGSNTLIGENTVNAWNISGAKQGTLNDSSNVLGWDGFGSLTGGTGNDTFTFQSGGSLSGNLNGGAGGVNELDYSGYGSAIGVNLQTHKTNGVTGTFSNINELVGDAIFEGTLTGANGSNTWSITGSDAGTVTGLANGFSNINNLVGGNTTDLFQFNGGTLSGTIDGGDAATDNTIQDLGSTGRIYTINGHNSGTIAVLLTGGFSNIQSLIAGTGNDTFSILNVVGVGLDGNINGGAGTDTLDYHLFAGVVNLTVGSATTSAADTRRTNHRHQERGRRARRRRVPRREDGRSWAPSPAGCQD